MSISKNLSELFARDLFAVHTVELLVRGQNELIRIPPFEYFTVFFDGDEVLLTESLRSDIENAIGAPLVEGPAIGNMGSVNILRLTVPLTLKVEIEAALKQFQSTNPSSNS